MIDYQIPVAAARRKAFAYIRFSRPEQSRGDSLRRQLDLCRDYCERHSIILDDRPMEDLGISGYRGKNSKEGALSKFLEAMREKKIPRGSVLIVEDLDRISREKHTDALSLFLEIVKAGVSIVTTNDNTEYSKAALDLDISAFLKPLLSLGTAGKESQKKSERLLEAWQQKRKNIGTQKLTAVCPWWLRPATDKKSFEPIPERVALIKRMFEMSGQGMGRFSIARQFNREKIPPWNWGKRTAIGWNENYVGNILKNRAVLGEFQPCKGKVFTDPETGVESLVRHLPDGPPIADYFPAIIDSGLFHAVQRKPQKTAGRIGEGVMNLFPTLMLDGYNNLRMRYRDGGVKEAHHKPNRFFFSEARRLLPDQKFIRWNYADFESAFLTFITDIDWKQVLQTGKPEEEHRLEAAVLSEQAAIDESQRRCDNIGEHIANGAAEGIQSATLMKMLVQNEAKTAECRTRLKALTKELNKIAATHENLAGSIEEFKRLATKAGQSELRLRLREEIRSRVEKILLFPDGWPIGGNRPTVPKDKGFIVVFRNGCSSYVTVTKTGGNKIEFAPSGESVHDPTRPSSGNADTDSTDASMLHAHD